MDGNYLVLCAIDLGLATALVLDFLYHFLVYQLVELLKSCILEKFLFELMTISYYIRGFCHQKNGFILIYLL
jgi:hypothetical protein